MNPNAIVEQTRTTSELTERLRKAFGEAGEDERRQALSQLVTDSSERCLTALHSVLKNADLVPGTVRGETLMHVLSQDEIDRPVRFQLANTIMKAEPSLRDNPPELPIGCEKSDYQHIVELFCRYEYPDYLRELLQDKTPNGTVKTAARSTLTGTETLSVTLDNAPHSGRDETAICADVLQNHFSGLRRKLDEDDWLYEPQDDLDPIERTEEVYELVCEHGLSETLDQKQRRSLTDHTRFAGSNQTPPVNPLPASRLVYFFAIARTRRHLDLIDIAIQNGDFASLNSEDVHALYQFVTASHMSDLQTRSYEQARKKAADFLAIYPHERSQKTDKLLRRPEADIELIEDLLTRRQLQGLKAERRARH